MRRCHGLHPRRLESRALGSRLCLAQRVAGAGQFHRAPAAAQEREACAVFDCKARIGWCQQQLARMVRTARWSRRRGSSVDVDRLMGPDCERADGASGEHLEQGCSSSEAPSRAGQQGRSLRYAGRRLSAGQTWKSPPQATSDGSVSGPQVVLHFFPCFITTYCRRARRRRA
jgi:hypothetical protein